MESEDSENITSSEDDDFDLEVGLTTRLSSIKGLERIKVKRHTQSSMRIEETNL